MTAVGLRRPFDSRPSPVSSSFFISFFTYLLGFSSHIFSLNVFISYIWMKLTALVHNSSKVTRGFLHRLSEKGLDFRPKIMDMSETFGLMFQIRQRIISP